MLCEHVPSAATRRGVLAGLACGCIGLAGCATNPATGQSSLLGLSSVEDDVKIGATQFPELVKAFGGAYEQGNLQTYVTNIGKRIAATTELPNLPYEFVVMNSPIVNAFALPGGKIALSRGLLALAGTEAEVASVLAHEAGHVTARHGAQGQNRGMLANLGLAVLGIATGSSELMQLGQTVAQGFLQRYSREQEFEADSLGVRYMARAGYDPSGSPAFLGSMREQSQLDAEMRGLPPGQVDEYNIMASHPRTVERVQQAQAAGQGLVVPNPRVGRPEFMAAINGLLFGDDPAQGLIRGRSFIHPTLRFAFETPEGFLLQNTAQAVTAQSQSGAAIIFDSAAVERSRSLPEYIQTEWAQNAPLAGMEEISVNGIPAATAVTRINGNSGQLDVRLVAYGVERGRAYRFLFATPVNQTQALSGPLRGTTYSFRRIDEREAAAVKPLRIVVSQVRAGDSVAKLAQGLPYGRFNEAWFRLLNDIPPGQDVAAGQTVKIVTA